MNCISSGSAVLDSSVVIKWFQKHEAFREYALQLRQAYLNGDLKIYVPDLLIYEIGNVLRYKPDMNQAKVQQALQYLYNMRIIIRHIENAEMQKSIEIAYSYDITIYDAVFVALAKQLGANFITDDKRLLQKLHKISYAYHLSELKE